MYQLLFVFLIVETKSLILSSSPDCTTHGAATLSSLPDSSLNNSSSRRQRSAFVSPQISPTRHGNYHVSHSQQFTAASRYSPVEGMVSTAGPDDVPEPARKSTTLPAHADRIPMDSNNIYIPTRATSSVVDGPGDMAKYGVAPKALSRDELTSTDLDIGSVVEFDIGSERHYGVIRWIGYLTDKRQVLVGIELVSSR